MRINKYLILAIFFGVIYFGICLSSLIVLAQRPSMVPQSFVPLPAHPAEVSMPDGYIMGYVLDEDGNPVPNAVVSLWQDGQLWRPDMYNDYSGSNNINPQTTRITYVNAEGFVKEGGFLFDLPYPDEYNLTAEKDGYKGSVNVHVSREVFNISDTASRSITVNITLDGYHQPTFTPEQLSYTGAIVGQIRDIHGYRNWGGDVSLWQDSQLVNMPNNPKKYFESNYSGTQVDYVFEHLAPGRYTVMVSYFAYDYNNDTVTVDVDTRPMRADIALSHELMFPDPLPDISFKPTVGVFVASPQASLSPTALPSTTTRPAPGLPGIIVVLVIGFIASLLYKKNR